VIYLVLFFLAVLLFLIGNIFGKLQERYAPVSNGLDTIEILSFDEES